MLRSQWASNRPGMEFGPGPAITKLGQVPPAPGIPVDYCHGHSLIQTH